MSGNSARQLHFAALCTIIAKSFVPGHKLVAEIGSGSPFSNVRYRLLEYGIFSWQLYFDGHDEQLNVVNL